MPLSQIPPWLSISPESYLKAAQSGAEAGLGVARIRQAALEAQRRDILEADQFSRKLSAAAQQFQDELAFKTWEEQQKEQLHAESLAAEMQKAQAEIGARTAYNLANMALRSRTEQNKEALAQQNLSFRKASEDRLNQTLDLARQRLQFSREQEARRVKGTISPETKAEAQMLMEDRRKLLDQKLYETDPAKLSAIDQTIEDLRKRVLELYPAAEAPAGVAVPTPIGGLPAWAGTPTGGAGFAPGMTFAPDITGEGGELPAPTGAEMAPTSGYSTNWTDLPGGGRIRIKPGSEEVTPSPGPSQDWPANEEPY